VLAWLSVWSEAHLGSPGKGVLDMCSSVSAVVIFVEN